MAAPTFDPSVGEAFTALAVGATVCLADRATVAGHLAAALAASVATHVCTTPRVKKRPATR